MNKSFLAWLFVLVAAVAGAIAAVVVSNNRASVARDRRAAAEARADAEASAEKKARAEAQTETKRAEAEKAKLVAEKESRLVAEAQKKAEADALRRAQVEAETQTKRLKASENEAKAAAEKASAAKLLVEAARLTNETAQAAVKLAEAKQNTAFAETERVRLAAEKAAAEAKTLELRQADLDAYEQSLIEIAQDLAEREAILKPEKTAADLIWLPDADTEVDEKGKLRPRKKEPYLAENDRRLSAGTRELARQDRLRREATEAESAASRTNAVADLEKLCREAEAADRPLTAAYVRTVLKSLYPDWSPSPQKKEESK